MSQDRIINAKRLEEAVKEVELLFEMWNYDAEEKALILQKVVQRIAQKRAQVTQTDMLHNLLKNVSPRDVMNSLKKEDED